jgi:uncharacterized protein with HEPN domain
MSPSKKNDLLYLLNILEYIGKIWKYTEETNSAEELFELNDQLNLNASLTLLANIGENVSKMSQNLKRKYSKIEWKGIKEFRNRIVHDYVGIDLAIVYEIITNDLKILKPEIENIIKENLKQNIFDIEEIELCQESKFYKNIDFKEIIL